MSLDARREIQHYCRRQYLKIVYGFHHQWEAALDYYHTDLLPIDPDS